MKLFRLLVDRRANVSPIPYFDRYLTGILTLIAAGLCFYRINCPALWIDETAALMYGLASWHDITNHADFVLIQLPHLFYYLCGHTGQFFGSPDIGARFWSALAGGLSIGFTYLLAFPEFGRVAAAIAATLACVSPFFIEYAQNARPYQLDSLGYLALLFFFRRFVERADWKSIAGFVLTSSLLLRLDAFGVVRVALFFPVLLAFFLLSRSSRKTTETLGLPQVERRQIGQFVIASAMIALLWTPFLWRFLRAIFVADRLHTTTVDGFWTHFSLSPGNMIHFLYEGYYPFGMLGNVQWLIMLSFAAAIALPLLAKRPWPAIYLTLTYLQTLVIVFVMNSMKAAVMPKRFLFWEPMLAVLFIGGLGLLSHGLAAAAQASFRVRSQVLMKALAAACLIGLLKTLAFPLFAYDAYRLGNYYYTERKNYKTFAKVLEAYLRPDDLFLWKADVGHDQPWLVELPYLTPLTPLKPERVDSGRVDRETVDSLFRRDGRLWFFQLTPDIAGIPREDFARIRLGDWDVFLLDKSFLQTPKLARQAEDQIMTLILKVSPYPQIETVAALLKLHDADASPDPIRNEKILATLYQPPFNEDAVRYAAAHSPSLGSNVSDRLLFELADHYFWYRPLQLEAQDHAAKSGDVKLSQEYRLRAAVF